MEEKNKKKLEKEHNKLIVLVLHSTLWEQSVADFQLD